MNKSESKYFNTAVKMDMALIALLKSKPLEYITVRELCETAGVNRSTFYLHYETIGDLLEETARYMLDEFCDCFSVDERSVAFNIASCELDELKFIAEKYLVPYLTYIRDNKEIFAVALSHKKLFRFEEVYKRLFENIFNPILARFNYPEKDREYVMMYYLNGINAIIEEWLRNNCDKSIKEISQIINVCVYGLENVLLRHERLNP